MKFTLNTTKWDYEDKNEIKSLSKLGFLFEVSEFGNFKILNTPTIEINTIEELIHFIETHGGKVTELSHKSIIISIEDNNNPSIIIYDYYNE